jgi:hypothetical protein
MRVSRWRSAPAALALGDVVVHASAEREAFSRIVIEAQAGSHAPLLRRPAQRHDTPEILMLP